MKIAIDLQGLQSKQNFYRGIGRYSLSLIKEILSTDYFDEIILVANSNLPNLRFLFEQEIKSNDSKCFYFINYFPDRNSCNNLSDADFLNLAINFKSYTYALFNVDLILITSFFEGFDSEAIIPFDKKTYDLPPITSLIYDLIPFMHPKLYLDGNTIYKNFYLKRFLEIKNLDYIFTISDSALNEICDHLDFDLDRIINISSACDKSLFVTKENHHIRNEKKYILYSGAADPRKNLKTLLIAYSHLAIGLRKKYSLVIVGNLLEAEILEIHQILKDLNLNEHNVELKGYLSDDLLVEYYQNCSLFVFPSIHEGFGLPVLEAISCGAPVIASSLTSIPEILNYEEALFDPFDAGALALKISSILANPELQKNLISKGLISAKRFSWKITANKFIDYCQLIINNNPLNTSNEKILDTNTLEKLLIDQSSCSLKNYHNEGFLKSIAVCLLLNKNNYRLYRKNITAINSNLEWLVEGPYDSTYSLAILNQHFALALEELDEKVILKSSEGLGDYKPNITYLERNNRLYELHKKSLTAIHNSSVNTRNMYPPRVNDMKSNINFIHAFGWEETELPLQYVIDFNTYLTGITVMSEQVKKILIDNGVSIPISVCGLGSDHLKNIQKDSNFLLKTKGFTFLHISSCFPRKGAQLLLDAYAMSFTIEDNVTLIIKTFPNPHNNISQYLTKLKEKNPLFPEVILIEKDLDKNQIVSLYNLSNVLVAPSFGEGFGLPIAEAMFMGVPVITTNWGGQTDFCNSDSSWLIDYHFEYSQSHFGLFNSVWARPSTKHLAKLMFDLFNSPKEDIAIKVNQARSNIINKFTWKDTAKNNIKAINKNTLNLSSSLDNIGWISSWNTKCGIASYSERLVHNILNHVEIFSHVSSELIFKDENNVRRCWKLDHPSLDLLYEEIIHTGIKNLVIQFNYGFFDFCEFSKFIDRILAKKISIIIFLHSTNDPKNVTEKKLSTLSSAFKKVDRLLVHTPKDMNRLKSLDLVENVSLFPHGIIDSGLQPLINKSSKTKTISTFGFCLPNKGFSQLIKSIVLLNKKGYKFSLNMYTSIYNENYLFYYDKLVKLIHKEEANKFIKIDSEYKSDEIILEELSKSDLIVLPYQSSGESSSAAVRQAIASLVPVAVTPLSIFDDVLPVVYKLPGISVEHISDGIIDFFNNNENLNKSNISNNLGPWMEQNSFSSLGYRLEEMIKSISNNKLII